MPEVSLITGLSRSTIYQYMSEGKFPQSISLGGRMTGWSSESIDDWINNKIEGGDDGNYI